MVRGRVRRLARIGLCALVFVAVAACTPSADESAPALDATAPAATLTPAVASPTSTPTAPAASPSPTAAPTTSPTPTASPAPTSSPTQTVAPTSTPAATPSTTTASLSLDGIAVAPERCEGYDRDHFASYDARALRDRWDADDGSADGIITGWYTGERLQNTGRAVHVEHVVALKEAWCSGYRESSLGNWSRNLRPAQAALNSSKADRDPAEWDRPDLPGWCRYLALHVEVKRELGMTADRAELEYIARSWSSHCGDAASAPVATSTPTPEPAATAEPAYDGPQPARTCGEFGWRVDRRTHPNLYAALAALGMRDGNSDGIMCNAERAYTGRDYPAP